MYIAPPIAEEIIFKQQLPTMYEVVTPSPQVYYTQQNPPVLLAPPTTFVSPFVNPTVMYAPKYPYTIPPQQKDSVKRKLADGFY